MKPSELNKVLAKRLPLLGHRNWIAVTDSAYPLQSADGVETLTISASLADTLTVVLRQLKKSRHVRPLAFTDSELAVLNEKILPNISGFRAKLDSLLADVDRQRLPHEEIIKQLDLAARKFNVLVIKTAGTLPYTSVFFRLECAYWSERQEQALRRQSPRISSSQRVFS
jgi:D-ribose pyranose/furanose isomerase RbsD